MLPVEPTNLVRLKSRGAKVLVYHGVSDAIFSVNDTTAWYEGLRAANQGDASDFARLFRVPGMAHCAGGPSTDQFDMLTPLVDWVERGQAPESVVARTPWRGQCRRRQRGRPGELVAQPEPPFVSLPRGGASQTGGHRPRDGGKLPMSVTVGGVDSGRQDTRISAVIPPRRLLPFLFVSILAASLCSEAGSADAPASRPAKAAQPAKPKSPPGLKWRVQKLFVDNNEGCAVADFNRDGKLDLSAGEGVVCGARVQGAQAAPKASALREGLPDLERRARLGCERRWLAGCRERFLHGAGDLLV